MNAQSIPKPVPELIWRELDDGLILVSPEAGKVRVLNQVGTTIWRLLAEGCTVGEIQAQLVETYDVPSQEAAADLEAFLSDLAERGVIIWDNQAT